MAVICAEKSGMLNTFEPMPTMPMPTPRPKSAVPIGRPIASTEPNAMRRMTIAGEDAEQLALGELERREDLTAVFDLETGHGDAARLRLDLLRQREVLGLVALGDLHLGERDRRDLAVELRAGRVVDHVDALDLADLGEQRRHRRLDRRIRRALRGGEHDLAGVAGRLVEACRGERVDDRLRLAVGQIEAGAVAGAHGAGDHTQADEEREPDGEGHHLAAAETPSRETSEHERGRFLSWGSGGSDGSGGVWGP